MISEVSGHTNLSTDAAPSRGVVAGRRILLVCGEPEPVSEMQQIVELLSEQGCHVTCCLERTGDLSRWLSGRGIYYYLSGCRQDPADISGSAQGFSPFLHRLTALIKAGEFYAVCTVASSASVVAARLAAAACAVPKRFAVQVGADRSIPAGAKSAAQARCLDTHADSVDPLRIVDVLTLPIVPGSNHLTVALYAKLLSLKFRWTFGSWSQKYWLHVKRLIDIVVSTSLLTITAPLIAALVLSRVVQGQAAIEKVIVIGKNNNKFDLFTFAPRETAPSSWKRAWWWLPAHLNVLRGEVSLIGPRLLTPEQWKNPENEVVTYWLAPGLASWSYLKASGDGQQSQQAGMDSLYMATVGPLVDLRIAAMALLSR